MERFNYVNEARAICDELDDARKEWRGRIDNAVASGTTGSEVLMALRWNMMDLLNAQIPLSAPVVARIESYLVRINKLLG